MIFISRDDLPIVSTKGKLDAVDAPLLRSVLLKKPGNVVYFESAGKFYGIVTYGDVKGSSGGRIAINTSFTALPRSRYMEARRIFLKANDIREIPVVEEGILLGEYNKFDDGLLLDRARGYEYNAYAQHYFEHLHHVALVRPSTEGARLRRFDSMRNTLDRYRTDYEIIDFKDIPSRYDDFEMFLVVDEQERRGARIVVELLDGHPWNYDKICSYLKMRSLLESSATVDYVPMLREFAAKGIEVLLVSEEDPKSGYSLRIQREMAERYPKVNNNIAKLMRQYEEGFFDDLASNRDYVDNIEGDFFVVEKDREAMRFMDASSPYINVRRGERVTVGQPEDYERTVFFYGPCLMIGAFVGDEYTVESNLQRMLNERGYKVRVVNCGCWGGNVATIGRMATTLARKGDIMVVLLEETDVDDDGIERFQLWPALEKHDVPSRWLLESIYHVNHHVSRIYAEELFEQLFGNGRTHVEPGTDYIALDLDLVDKFFIKKYLDGVKLDGLGKVACCAINGCPFTYGHLHLIETASREMDHVYILSIMEDSSIFSFSERYAMAVDAVAHLDNVTVLPSGLFIGNSANFPAYYAKMYMGDTAEQARSHVNTYASVAKLLRVTHRYVGQEIHDPVSEEINKACLEILPQHGIETVVLDRFSIDGTVVTGSLVRGLAEDDSPMLDTYVPETTADIIRCKA